ncbi:MAG: hypothetical protein QOK16_4340, partial [Solirubrobacteraceae bacterium]|nr:hypothetical protein [Solirubrobacteraceae bacterium]
AKDDMHWADAIGSERDRRVPVAEQ